MITEEPIQPRRPLTTEHEAAAFRDGWNVATNVAPRNQRPNYLTNAEREALDRGWYSRHHGISPDNVRPR
jgi:hypothetical protein